MTRIKIACAALAVPFLMASCVTDRSHESADSMNTIEVSTDQVTEASTDEVIEELDPNDPDVMVCPVTGQMQRKSDASGSTHGTGTNL